MRPTATTDMRARLRCGTGFSRPWVFASTFAILQTGLLAVRAGPGELGFTTPLQELVREDAGGIWLVVERIDGADGVVQVHYRSVGLSATSDEDFESVSGLLEFMDGQTNQSFFVPLINDTDIETAESFSLVLSEPDNGATLSSTRFQTFVPIQDDDDPGAFEVSAGSYSETNGVAEVVITRVRAWNGMATVDLATEDGTALGGEDYVATNRTVTFDDGETEKTAAIVLIDDVLVEEDEFFTVTLANPSPGATIVAGSATVTLLSEDRHQEVGFTTNRFYVEEQAGSARIDVERLYGSAGTVTVRYDTAGGSGYERTGGTLTFLEGETVQSFFVPIFDDAFPQSGNFFVLLGELSGDAILSEELNDATVIILNDDTVESYGQATFHVAAETVTEADGFARIVVRRMRSPEGSASVDLATRDGTAVAGSDYVSTQLTVSFEDGESTQVLFVPLIDDRVTEASETFHVDLANSSVGSGIAVGTATVTVSDDDPTVRFGARRYPVAESEGTVQLAVTRATTLGELTVRYFSRSVSAETEMDYEAAEGSLTWGEGQAETSIELTVLPDDLVEGAEEFDVYLVEPGPDGRVLDRTAVEILADPSLPESCTRSGLTATVASGGEHSIPCDAFILLTETLVVSNAVTIDGLGHDVTLSGRGEHRLFEVRPEGRLTLIGIKVEHGAGTEAGAILNDGELTLIGCDVWNNHVEGGPGNVGFVGARGLQGLSGLLAGTAGLYTDGAPGGAGGPGGAASGGAVLNRGELWATNGTFHGNSATGGQAGAGGSGGSGGVINDEFGRTYGTAAGGIGGIGGVGGEALGGALCNVGSAVLSGIVFAGNNVCAGEGGAGSRGGGGGSLFDGFTLSLDGAGGLGGRSAGGAIFNSGSLVLDRVSLVRNLAQGGTGGAGHPRATGSQDLGGPGGGGGVADGGALWNEGTVTLVNSTVGANRSQAGRGGRGAAGPDASGFYIGVAKAGDGGDGSGGGIFNLGLLEAVNCTIWDNLAEGGLAGGFETTLQQIWPELLGVPGGGFGDSVGNEAVCGMVNTILGGSGANASVFGPVIDRGHNICADGSAALSAPGSRNSTDPRLGPLRDRGRGSLAFSLSSLSPALDAGDDGACPLVDQLGFPRPAGAHCDIGAVEQTFLRIMTLPDGMVRLSYAALAGTRCHLESSGNLEFWEGVEEVVADLNGAVLFTPLLPASHASFRVRLEE